MRLLLWLILTLPVYATDFTDFVLFAQCWQKPRCWECRDVDYAYTGVVDYDDLIIFAERWIEVSYPNKVLVQGTSGLDGVYILIQEGAYGLNGAADPHINLLNDPIIVIMNVLDIAYTSETGLFGTYEAGIGYTGTATITEYTGVTMADFNYYSTSIGGSKCYRIVDPTNELVWDKTANDNAGGLVAYSAITYANGNIEITYQAGGPAYPVSMPSGLPRGDYDLLFFNAAYGSATASDFEGGMGGKWTGKAFLVPPTEKFVDRIR